MATAYDELHGLYDNNLEEYSSEADIKLEDFTVQTGDFLDSKAGISSISDHNVVQGVVSENIKVENLDQRLSENIGSTENCEKYNSDADIKLEDCKVQTGDSLDSKAGISLISEDVVAQGVLLENIKVENLNEQSDKSLQYKYGPKPHKVSHKLDKIVVCGQCGKSFEGKNKLYQHFRSVHLTRKVHPCSYCERTYRCKIDLTRHIKTHTGEKPFSCEVCKKSFSQKCVLMTHIRMHTGEKPFTCELCKKSFCWKAGLISHIKTHTGEKPFTCDICKKSFSRKQALKVHIENHNGDKPFTCEFCKESFSWRNGLISHMKTHAVESRFTCEVRKNSFCANDRLNKRAGEKRLTAKFVRLHTKKEV